MKILLDLDVDAIAEVLEARKIAKEFTYSEVAKRAGTSSVTIRRLCGKERDGRCGTLQSTLQVVVIQGFKMSWHHFIARVLLAQKVESLLKPSHVKNRGANASRTKVLH